MQLCFEGRQKPMNMSPPLRLCHAQITDIEPMYGCRCAAAYRLVLSCQVMDACGRTSQMVSCIPVKLENPDCVCRALSLYPKPACICEGKHVHFSQSAP